MRSLFIVAVLGTLCVVGCGQNTSPTHPSAAPSATSSSSVTAQSVDPASSSTTTETVNGNGASASFNTVNGCVSNSVAVTAGTNVTTTNSGTTSLTVADLSIASADTCAGVSLGTSTGSASNVNFSADLNGATLNGTIAVVDASSGGVHGVPVSLTWTGTGTISHTTTNTKIVTGTVTTTIHTKDASRAATVSGTVDGLAAGTAQAMLFQNATVTKTH